MKIIITAILFFIINLGLGQERLVVDSSSISFQVKNAGITVNGSFTGLEAQIDFNPRKLKSSSIVASVDARSIDTGIRIRNNHLRREDYFDANNYPRIVMKSESFKRKGGRDYIGDFTIILKGKEDHVQLPFSFQQVGVNYIFTARFDINRRDFDIGGESLILDDHVHVTILVKTKEGQGNH